MYCSLSYSYICQNFVELGFNLKKEKKKKLLHSGQNVRKKKKKKFMSNWQDWNFNQLILKRDKTYYNG